MTLWDLLKFHKFLIPCTQVIHSEPKAQPPKDTCNVNVHIRLEDAQRHGAAPPLGRAKSLLESFRTQIVVGLPHVKIWILPIYMRICVCWGGRFCLQLVSQETPNSNKIRITDKCKFQSQQNVERPRVL